MHGQQNIKIIWILFVHQCLGFVSDHFLEVYLGGTLHALYKTACCEMLSILNALKRLDIRKIRVHAHIR